MIRSKPTLSAIFAAAALMASDALSAVPPFQVSIPADFARAAPQDVQTIFGLVHAASATAPSDALTDALRPLYWRAGRLTAEIAPRMRAAGAMPVQALSDVWGYPSDGRPPPFGDFTAFGQQVRLQAQQLGPDAIYSVWNEANSSAFWGGWFPAGPTRLQDAERRFYDTFEVAYRAVDGVHGRAAKLAGPSLNRYDLARISHRTPC